MLVGELFVFGILPHFEAVDDWELLHDLALTFFVFKLSYCSLLEVLNVGIRDQSAALDARLAFIPVDKIVG